MKADSITAVHVRPLADGLRISARYNPVTDGQVIQLGYAPHGSPIVQLFFHFGLDDTGLARVATVEIYDALIAALNDARTDVVRELARKPIGGQRTLGIVDGPNEQPALTPVHDR